MPHLEQREEHSQVSQPPRIYDAMLHKADLSREFIDASIGLLPNLDLIPSGKLSPVLFNPQNFDDIISRKEDMKLFNASIGRSPQMEAKYRAFLANDRDWQKHISEKFLLNEPYVLVPDEFPITVSETVHSQLWIRDEQTPQEELGVFLAHCFDYLGLDPLRDVVAQEKRRENRSIEPVRHIHILHRWPATIRS